MDLPLDCKLLKYPLWGFAILESRQSDGIRIRIALDLPASQQLCAFEQHSVTCSCWLSLSNFAR